MDEQDNISQSQMIKSTLINEIELQQTKLQEAFLKRCIQQTEIIEFNNIQDVLNDFSTILSYDCESAIQIFTKENLEQQNINIQEINFQEFYKVFKAWAQQQQNANDSPKQSEIKSKKNDSPNEHSNNDQAQQGLNDDQEQQPLNNKSKIYSQHNKMIYERFMNQFSKEVYNYYKDFAKEYDQEKQPLVASNDIPLIMRVVFYIDNITFHLTREDNEEYFNKPNCYKRMMIQIENFLQEKQIQQNNFTNYKFPYKVFLEFIEYFLLSEPDIFLRHDNPEDEGNTQDQVENEKSEQYKKQTQLEKEIRENIQKYEKMVDEASSQQEKLILNNMLSVLYKELEKIQIIQKSPPKSKKRTKGKVKMSQQEQRQKNLEEIFIFYCKQDYVHGSQYSFERLIHESHTCSLANFMLFCKQFNIIQYNKKLGKKELQLIFKKNAPNYRELEDVNQFQVILEKVALIMFEEKEEDLPTDLDKVEAFYKYVGIDNQNFYRQQMQLLQPPFNIQDKEGFRQLPQDVGRPIKISKIPPKLQDELRRRKEERNLLVQQFLSPQNMLNQSKKHNMSSPNVYRSINYNDSYAQKMQKFNNAKLDLNSKISWQQLERISYSDMKNLNQGKFKPTDLFDEMQDNDDKMYLAEFDLQEERKRKQELAVLNKKGLENYGTIKYQQPNRGNNQQDDSLERLNNKYQPKGSNLSKDYMQRANQVEYDQMQKDKARIDNLANQNNKKIALGMQSIKKL